jgi:hypothetical protein
VLALQIEVFSDCVVEYAHGCSILAASEGKSLGGEAHM